MGSKINRTGEENKNNYNKIINMSKEELAEYLAEYKLCNVCEYQARTLCQSISHKQENCVEGILLFLNREE